MKKWALLAAALAAIALMLLVIPGAGYRAHLWSLPLAFRLFGAAFFVGAAAAAVAVLLLLIPATRRGRGGVLSASLFVALATAWYPWHMLRVVHGLPLIHDITTDPADPPQFDAAILSLRATAPNTAVYGGAPVAALQEKAYPWIKPEALPMPPASAYARALAAARAMGWRIVAAEPGQGRIEATATTPWWGFKDDVVVRIRASGGASRVDVRSESRVGESDLGVNAARIRAYLARLRGA